MLLLPPFVPAATIAQKRRPSIVVFAELKSLLVPWPPTKNLATYNPAKDCTTPVRAVGMAERHKMTAAMGILAA